MGPRVLVMGAGTGASNNLVASLRASLPSLTVIGCHADPFVLKKSAADRNYLFDTNGADLPQIHEIVAREAVDVIIPTGDADVSLLSNSREELGDRVYLPAKSVIRLCQDKYELTEVLAAHDVAVAVSFPITTVDDVDAILEKLAWAPRVWCRLRSGSRSLGAGPVLNAQQARSWLDLWQSLRGVPADAFMVAEYLPGRDFLCQSLWQNGRLVLVKTFERIAYFGGENSPGGVSSLSSLAKTIQDDRVVDVCTRAVRALAPDASGAFSIDLKENRDEVPCITEINAGRFFIGMTAFDHVGVHNMSACFVRLALGETVSIDAPYDCPPDYYLVRDLDTAPGVFHADQVLQGVERLGF
jgi:predicted ATP-grasp superfamily ATP-dependent carboligase